MNGRAAGYRDCQEYSPAQHSTKQKGNPNKYPILYYLYFPPGALSCLVTSGYE